MSYKDALTNIGNRFAMSACVDNIDKKQSIGVVYCDVTGLKYVDGKQKMLTAREAKILELLAVNKNEVVRREALSPSSDSSSSFSLSDSVLAEYVVNSLKCLLRLRKMSIEWLMAIRRNMRSIAFSLSCNRCGRVSTFRKVSCITSSASWELPKIRKRLL